MLAVQSGGRNKNTTVYVGHSAIFNGSTQYMAMITTASTTTFQFSRTDTNPTSVIGIDPNFALANNDDVYFNLEYETT